MKGKEEEEKSQRARESVTHSWTERVGQKQFDRDSERHWGRTCKMQSISFLQQK